jgi:hypothetical protein
MQQENLRFSMVSEADQSPAPHRRRRNPPRTPGIKFIEALFNFLVNNKVFEPSGRKEGSCRDFTGLGEKTNDFTRLFPLTQPASLAPSPSRGDEYIA